MPIRHKSIKLVRDDRLKTFMDRRLIQALHHPVREHILAVLNERIASPVEIGDEIELDVTAFHKEIKFLEKLDLIELVGEGPTGSAPQHFYRAKATTFFDDEAWAKVPTSIKKAFEANFMGQLLDEIFRSFKSGRFHARADRHFSWMPVMLDLRGWREVMALLNRTLNRLLVIQRRSAERLHRSGKTGIPVTLALLGFERGPGFTPPARR